MTATPHDAVGVDGYPGGWVGARRVDGHLTWATALVEGIEKLCPPDAVTGIDMPIGLLDRGLRECDALARRALPGAASRVFTTPPRAVLALGPQAANADAQRLSRELSGQGVSRQALALGPRILAVEALARLHPDRVVVEVHPELSFAALAGRVLDPKKRAAGVGQRMAALQAWLPDIAQIVARAPSDVPIDDALDALAALWSATRWRDGTARTLPEGASQAPFIAV